MNNLIRICEIIILLSATFVVTTYASAYYHEYLNRHILSEYNISSHSYFYLIPKHLHSLWYGNDTVIAATQFNTTQLDYLGETNSLAYNAILSKLKANENPNAQTNSLIMDIIIVYIIEIIILYYFRWFI